MLNALRLHEGFPVAWFTSRTGLPSSAIEPAIERAEARGLVRRDLERLVPTELGLRFLSDLQAMFLPTKTSLGRGARLSAEKH